MHLFFHYLKDLTTFTIGYVFIRLLSRWIGDKVYKKLIKTERELAIWRHYKKRATGIGHAHESPLHCQDDDCGIVKPLFTRSKLALRRRR